MLSAACSPPRPIVVSVEFRNAWRVGGAPLTTVEQDTIRRTALREMASAFQGFDVRFSERDGSARVIRIEDTPYDVNGRRTFGAAGVTYPAATVSSVRFDVLANALLAAVRCRDVDHCQRPRAELVAALGRGIGATGAHELGHQSGFLRFALDAACADCFDGTGVSYAHFFGEKHWSQDAEALMDRTLPRIR